MRGLCSGGKGKGKKGKEKGLRHLHNQEIDLYTPSRAGGGESGRKEKKEH